MILSNNVNYAHKKTKIEGIFIVSGGLCWKWCYFVLKGRCYFGIHAM